MDEAMPLSKLTEKYKMSPAKLIEVMREAGCQFSQHKSGSKVYTFVPIGQDDAIDAAVAEYRLAHQPKMGRATNEQLDRNACAELRAELLPLLQSLSDRLDAVGVTLQELLDHQTAPQGQLGAATQENQLGANGQPYYTAGTVVGDELEVRHPLQKRISRVS